MGAPFALFDGMDVRAFLVSVIVLVLPPVCAHAESSCEHYLRNFQLSDESADNKINERLARYKGQSPDVALANLARLKKEIGDELKRARREYRHAARLYRAEFTVWQRLNPHNGERRRASDVLYSLDLYIQDLWSNKYRVIAAINQIKGRDDERRRTEGLVGDPSSMFYQSPLGNPNSALNPFSGGFQNNFSSGGDSGGWSGGSW